MDISLAPAMLFLVFVLNLSLAIWIFFWLKIKSQQTQVYFLLLLSIAFWAFVLGARLYTTEFPGITLSLVRAGFFFALFSSFFSLAFSLVFPSAITKHANAILLTYGLANFAIGGLVLTTDWFISGYQFINQTQTFVIETSGIYELLRGVYLFNTLFGIVIIAIQIARTTQEEQLQALYVGFGFIVSVIGILITSVFLPWIGNTELYWLGPIFPLFMMIFLTIAIVRYNLFNISLITAQIAAFVQFILLFALVLITPTSTGRLIAVCIIILFFGLTYVLIKEQFTRIARDRQLQKNAKKLKKANKELESLVERKNEFMTLISHQLRTPLTGIRAFTEFVIGDTEGVKKLSPKTQGNLNNLHLSVDRLGSIVNDILLALELSSGNRTFMYTSVNLEEFLQSIIDHHKDLSSERKVSVNQVKKPTEIKIDQDLLEIAINHIIHNAIIYGKSTVDIQVKESKDSVKIIVEDDGVGFDPENTDSLWTPFERGENSQRVHPDGSGLGLYLAKEIIEMHGGTIEVKSQGLNTGTTVTVTLKK